ncbi:MAG: DUF5047 domain-containing protein [Streptosporangiales bacterium]
MRQAIPELLAAVRSDHGIAARARVVPPGQTGTDPDGDEIDVYAGDVEADSTAQIRCTLDLTTSAADWSPRPRESMLQPYGNEVFVERGVEGVDLVPLGYYRIYDVDAPVDGTLRVAGQDRMSALVEAKLTATVQFKATATVAGVFDRLVHEVLPAVEVAFDYQVGADELGRSMVAGDPEDPDSDNDRYQFLADLATSRGKVMYFDEAGRLRVTAAPRIDVPVFAVDAGPKGVLLDDTRSLSRQGVYNGVVATGEGADAKEPVRALVVDTNPGSPTYWDGDFGKVPKFYSSPKLKTSSMAVDAAATLLGQNIGLPYSVDFAMVPNPALEVLDPIEITHRGGTAERHLIKQLTLGLTAADPQTGTTRDQSSVRIGAV